MPSPPEPVAIERVCASVDVLKTPAVEGALQQMPTYAVGEDALRCRGAEEGVAMRWVSLEVSRGAKQNRGG
jgi:hypothetical protein